MKIGKFAVHHSGQAVIAEMLDVHIDELRLVNAAPRKHELGGMCSYVDHPIETLKQLKNELVLMVAGDIAQTIYSPKSRTSAVYYPDVLIQVEDSCTPTILTPFHGRNRKSKRTRSNKVADRLYNIAEKRL